VGNVLDAEQSSSAARWAAILHSHVSPLPDGASLSGEAAVRWSEGL